MRTILILYGQIFVWSLLIVLSPVVVVVQAAITITVSVCKNLNMMFVMFYYKPKWAVEEIRDTLKVIKLKKERK